MTRPFFHACGARDAIISFTDWRVTYQIPLTYESTNIENGGLDAETGVFQASWPGSYQVTWSFGTRNDYNDRETSVYLRKNTAYIEESKIDSNFSP